MYDIIILGAGASGLMAAIYASKNNPQKTVLLVEANSKIGKKLLATGNGRCNLSNTNVSLNHYYADKNYIKGLLNEYNCDKIRAAFESFGIKTIEDNQGRVYPKNEQGAAVVKILSDICTENGVDCITDFNVVSTVKSDGYFTLKSQNNQEIKCKKLIICAGSKAATKLVGSEENYNITKQLGHSVTKLYPALTGFVSNEKFLKGLSGIRVKCLASINKKSSEGEVIFSDKGVSGICVFDLSIHMINNDFKNAVLSLDLLKDMSISDIKNYIQKLISARQNMLNADILNGVLNLKMAYTILKLCKIDPLLPSAKLKESDIDNICNKIKCFNIKISGTKGWADCQIAAGGVPLSEINPNTMESKLCSGLFFAGEILNIHADCGGFNLHWAWLSGMIAGKSASSDVINL